jgi:hypothetical protein
MATIKANGGATSVWENHRGERIVVCRNGKILQALSAGGYHHIQDPELADWAAHKCEPVGDFATMLRIRGWFQAANQAQVTTSTTIAAHWHKAAKTSRRLRERNRRAR